MKAMKTCFLLMGMLFGWTAAPLFGQDYDRQTKEILEQLDRTIRHKSDYHRLKEARIDSLKQVLQTAATPQEQCDLCGSLFYEYLHYQADSSLAYVERKARLLPRLNRPDLENEVRINRAEVMGVMGMYNEAGTELARVHKDALSTGGLLYYYHTQRAYHGWLADYTAYQPAKEKYLKITEAYRDSILSIIGPGLSTDIVRAERLLLAGNPDEALSLLASHDEDGMTMPNRAYLNYTLFEAWQKKGDVEHEIYYLARTALVDIRMAAREYASLQRLARLMYEQGDLARAYRYMACSMEDAVACNARLRFLEVTEFYPIVERAYRDLEEKKHDLQYVISVSVSILAILFITLAVYLYISMKKLAQMRQNLSIANGQLMAANRTLEETGKIKEVYIARYLDRCVMYLEKLEQYRLSLDKLLRASKMDELVKLVRSDNFLQDERKAFYKEFDKSFLNLFPNFITDFNQLLTDEGKIYPKQNELLNTELRIFALIRLGVTDANSIAHFLGYSLATVYNYRSKIRGKARGDKDTFEQQVMNL